jgi:hypothetical protein
MQLAFALVSTWLKVYRTYNRAQNMLSRYRASNVETIHNASFVSRVDNELIINGSRTLKPGEVELKQKL